MLLAVQLHEDASPAGAHPPPRRVVPGARLRRRRPLTGKDHYLAEFTRDDREAQKILTRLLGQVDEQRNLRTKATPGATLDVWLRTHQAEETTLDGHRGYVQYGDGGPRPAPAYPLMMKTAGLAH